MKCRNVPWLNVVLVLGALAVALPSLGYPLMRGHGLTFLTARAALRHGTPFYASTLDSNAPGNYVLQLLVMAVVGARPIVVRILDLAALAVLVASTVRVIGRLLGHVKTPDGVFGTTLVASVLFVFGYHSYADTGLGELSTCACLAASFYFVCKPEARIGHTLTAGFLCGFALLLRPTTAVFIPLVFIVMFLSTGLAEAPSPVRRRRAVQLAVGLTLPCLLMVVVLAAWGGLPAALAAHRENACWFPGVGFESLRSRGRELVGQIAMLAPVSGIALLMALVAASGAWLLRERRQLLVFGIATASTVAAVVAYTQLEPPRFAHTRLLWVLPLAMLVTYATATLQAQMRWGGRAFTAVLSGGLLLGYWQTHDWERFRPVWRGTYQHWMAPTTDASNEAYARLFDIDEIAHSEVDNRAIARFVREHSTEVDEVLVRGNETQLYATMNREFTGRFVWTTPLIFGSCEAVRTRMNHEAEAELARIEPRYVIALDVPSGPDSPAYFVARGYREIKQFGRFILLERGLPGP